MISIPNFMILGPIFMKNMIDPPVEKMDNNYEEERVLEYWWSASSRVPALGRF